MATPLPAYRAKHADRMRTKYQADPEAMREKMRAWRQANAEKARAQWRAYYQRAREEILARNRARRRARKLGIPIEQVLRPLKRGGPLVQQRKRRAKRLLRLKQGPALRARERAWSKPWRDANRKRLRFRAKLRRCGIDPNTVDLAA